MSEKILAAKAILDTDTVVCNKIEAANFACLEALRAMHQSGDPTITAVFGLDLEVIDSMLAMNRTEVSAVCRTGIPFWSFRIGAQQNKPLLNPNLNKDELLELVLRTFGGQIRVRSL